MLWIARSLAQTVWVPVGQMGDLCCLKMHAVQAFACRCLRAPVVQAFACQAAPGASRQNLPLGEVFLTVVEIFFRKARTRPQRSSFSFRPGPPRVARTLPGVPQRTTAASVSQARSMIVLGPLLGSSLLVVKGALPSLCEVCVVCQGKNGESYGGKKNRKWS